VASGARRFQLTPIISFGYKMPTGIWAGKVELDYFYILFNFLSSTVNNLLWTLSKLKSMSTSSSLTTEK